MHPNDIIIAVLTPGSAFNTNNKVFRGLETLAAFTGLPPADVLGLIHGDLSNLAVCKPSKKPGKILVALKANIPQKVVKTATAPVKISAMPVEEVPVPVLKNMIAGEFVTAAKPDSQPGVFEEKCSNEDCACHESDEDALDGVADIDD